MASRFPYMVSFFMIALGMWSWSCCCCNCNCGNSNAESRGKSIAEGMFVFGSSLVDNGNNNFLSNSIAKANYLPYGIDFPLGPSGRFTNGKNVIDVLGELLGIPTFIPPFSDPSTKGSSILHGVNFASGASGILDDTGLLAGNVITLSQQIRNFEEVTVPELEGQMRNMAMADYLFVIGTGGNDYSFNYFLGGGNSTSNVSLEAFTANLTTTLSHHLKRLYNKGGRKFVLLSVNPNGCSPMVIEMQPSKHSGCNQYLNRAACLFNSRLKSLVDVLGTAEMPGANLVFVNSYKIVNDIIRNPSSEGFEEARKACCEVGEEKGGILCRKGGSTCEDRRRNVFFDGLHPTEAVNTLIANRAFSSISNADVYPFNVKCLALL